MSIARRKKRRSTSSQNSAKSIAQRYEELLRLRERVQIAEQKKVAKGKSSAAS